MMLMMVLMVCNPMTLLPAITDYLDSCFPCHTDNTWLVCRSLTNMLLFADDDDVASDVSDEDMLAAAPDSADDDDDDDSGDARQRQSRANGATTSTTASRQQQQQQVQQTACWLPHGVVTLLCSVCIPTTNVLECSVPVVAPERGPLFSPYDVWYCAMHVCVRSFTK